MTRSSETSAPAEVMVSSKGSLPDLVIRGGETARVFDAVPKSTKTSPARRWKKIG